MIQKKDKIKYGTTTIPYYIIKSKRIKTSEIIVDVYNITIRPPIKICPKFIESVLDKATWILNKQKEYKETIPPNHTTII
jgi:predicted metal-dependent hydrolase